MKELTTVVDNKVKIDRHEFDEAKQRIKEFSLQSEKDISLPSVRTKDKALGFIKTDHKVTGNELNELTTNIQNNLVEANKAQINLVREFGEIYTALDLLDKEYITAIQVALEDIGTHTDQIDAAQNDINKAFEVQKETIEKFKAFKDRLEDSAHIYEVDILWDNVEAIRDSLEELRTHVDNLSKDSRELSSRIEALEKQELQVNELRSEIQYLTKAQKETAETFNESIMQLQNQYSDLAKENSALKDKIQKLTYQVYFAMGIAGIAIVLKVMG